MNEELIARLRQNKDNYWAAMGQVSQQLSAWLRDYCTKHNEFSPVCERYAAKRNHLNGLQVYAGFFAGGGNEAEWERFAPVAVAVEYVMVRAYALNQIVDHKKAVWERPGGVEQTACEQELMLALILQVLEESEEVLGDRFSVISRRIQQMLANMGKGFMVERQRLNVNISSLETVLEGWSEAYELRNRLIDQVYNDAPLIGYYLATGDPKVFQAHDAYFAERIGFSHAGQVINDLGDILPGHDSCVKAYQDRFADFRNGYITYPIWRLLDVKDVQEAFARPEVTLKKDWQQKMFQLVEERGLVQDSRAIGFSAWSNHVSFWSQDLGSENLLLLGTYSLLGFNKYFERYIK